MPAYTFSTLSDVDFEELVSDLLSDNLGVTLQPYTKGKDRGVDLSFGSRVAGSLIVQCKHYAGSKFSDLLTSVKKELPKLAALNPARYILATSLGLTPKNKTDLQAILAPYCLSVDDIYGREAINQLLRGAPKIEQSHFKLWLTSTAIISKLLRNGAYVWNAVTTEEINRKLSLYVQTQAFDEASKILQRENFVVLSGIPGIGKTTLAQMLVSNFVAADYQLIAVRESVGEAFEAFQSGTKQVVYFDDFLGQSTLSERGTGSGNSIAQLLTQAQRSKNLKVIFTTREYILAEALSASETLARAGLHIGKCVVEVEQYTREHRARMLYNHLFFSDLRGEHVASLLKDKAYKTIVDHPNYSPRIIEWMTVGMGRTGFAPVEFADRFRKTLDNPAEIWTYAFEKQIDEVSQNLLLILSTADGHVLLDDLREMVGALHASVAAGASDLAWIRRFRHSLRTIEGTFTRTTTSGEASAIQLHNPSIKDFLRARIAAEPAVSLSLIDHANRFDPLNYLSRIGPSGKMSESTSIPSGRHAEAWFQSATRNVLAAPSTAAVGVDYRGHRSIFRHERNVGQRLNLIARTMISAGKPEFVESLTDLAIEIIDSSGPASATDPAWLDLLSTCATGVGDAAVHPKLSSKVIPAVVSRLGEFDALAEEWLAFSIFFAHHRNWFSDEDRDAFAIRAEAFCDGELETIKQSHRGSSDAEASYSDVISIAKIWSLTLDDSHFSEWLEELKAHEEERDSDDDEWTRSRTTDGGSMADDAMDALFTSLETQRN